MGGGETHTLHLARALRGRGHDVRIWRTASASPVAENYEYEGIPVEVAPTDVFADVNVHGSTSASWLAQRLRQRPVDIVHVMIGGRCNAMMTALANARVPLVVTFLDFHYWCPQALQHADKSLCAGPESLALCHQCVLESAGRVHYAGPVWRMLPKSIQRLTAHVPRVETLENVWQKLASNAAFFDLLRRAGTLFVAPSPIMSRLASRAGVERDRILNLPYGVPDGFVGQARAKSPSSSLRLGFFGRIVPEKGVHVLTDAVSALRPDRRVELRLFGNAPVSQGHYYETLLATARRDTRIRFCGLIDQQRLPEIHRELDAVVIPSLWHENATIVLLESLALGTPVIASAVEGMAPFIESGRNGFTFPVGDAAALADLLDEGALNGARLRAMAASCEPVMTASRHAELMEAAYARLVDGHR